MIDICSFPDYLLVQIVLKKSLKYKSEVFLGLFADARIGILGIIIGWCLGRRQSK